jgi:type IV pilus assembly protein PilE
METVAMSYGKHEKGMTLIELMIVVLIIGILAGIAIPSYRAYVIRVTRTDAKVALTATAQVLERCYTRFNSYSPVAAVGKCETGMPYTTEGGSYRISGVPTATAYVLTATPQGGQAKDTACANFTLNQVGTQGVSGTNSATPNECWR